MAEATLLESEVGFLMIRLRWVELIANREWHLSNEMLNKPSDLSRKDHLVRTAKVAVTAKDITIEKNKHILKTRQTKTKGSFVTTCQL